MENHSYIEFKKERDLGSILSDTFKFIRENWKPYFLTVLKISAPALVIMLAALGFYFYSFSGMFSTISVDPSAEPSASSAFTMGLSAIVLMLAATATYVLMNMSSLYYIKSYINNNGKTTFEEVSTEVKQNFWSFLGLGILLFIILFFSIMLCFFPVIYTGVVLSLAFPIMVFEGRGIGDSISHCFTLIKDHWFNTFGVLFVVVFLVYVLSMIFSVPSLIYYFIKLGTSIGENDPTAVVNVFSDPIYF
nr:hypothetical protein [Flavobacteriaceae bacterium]